MSFYKNGDESFNVDNLANHQVLRKLIEKLSEMYSIFFFFFKKLFFGIFEYIIFIHNLMINVSSYHDSIVKDI